MTDQDKDLIIAAMRAATREARGLARRAVLHGGAVGGLMLENAFECFHLAFAAHLQKSDVDAISANSVSNLD